MASAEQRISIVNETQGSIVCPSASLANTFRTRLFGLLGKRSLAPDAGLLLKPCSGVHTLGMAFAIDVVSLDRRNCVIGLDENIGPWKIRGLSFRTRSVLELPAGQIRRSTIALGDQLEVHARA